MLSIFRLNEIYIIEVVNKSNWSFFKYFVSSEKLCHKNSETTVNLLIYGGLSNWKTKHKLCFS